MHIKKNQWPILVTNLILLAGFSLFFLGRQNYEFLIYVGVIIFFLFLILLTNKKVDYPNYLLWGLTLWSAMHLTGGGVPLGEGRLYEWIIMPLVGDPYYIFKYDQLVHIVGFAVATIVMWVLIKPLLKSNIKKWAALSIVVVMAGLGVGALNEIVEFTATVITPETGVGGYENTSLDLVADLIGAIGAMIFIYFKEKRG